MKATSHPMASILHCDCVEAREGRESRPRVILYDGPTTGLDPINAARINELILGIEHTLKITSVVVTHDMETAFSVSSRSPCSDAGK